MGRDILLVVGATALAGASFCLGLLILMAAFTGCIRPAGRDLCYAKADADAVAAYVEACEGYEDTSTCPEAARIEAEHQKAQGGCP